MKIWLMNHYASQMFYDKAGRHYWFAKNLKLRGNDVTVFCANTFLNREGCVDTEGQRYKTIVEDSTGVPFVFVRTKPSVGNGVDRVLNMSLFYWNLIPSAKSYAKKYGKPDVIIASSVHPLTMVAGIKIGKTLKVPCICEIRDLWPEAIFSFGKAREDSMLGRILVKGEHWIYKNANALIFTKEGDTDYLKERNWTTAQGGDIELKKCHYINNGIDIENFDKNMRENVLEDSDLKDSAKFIFTYAGVIRPVNNVGNILDAAKLVKDKGYKDICFLIYGDGMQKAELEQRCIDEDIDNVKMKGFVDRKYIPYILSKSSVNMLNYSQNQYNWTRGNSSNKLFEYMASGKPVLSTVKMGYSIIEKYQCGVELGDDSAEKLAEEIISIYKLSKTEKERIGDNARRGAMDFDFKILTNKLEDVINEVL